MPSLPLRRDDPYGRYLYEIKENLTRRYQIQSKLDGGFSGDVLECWDREGQESVAIKVLRSIRHPTAIMCEHSILRNLAERPESIPRVVQMRDSFAYRNHECIGQVLFQVHQKSDLEHLASMERVLGRLPKDMLQRARKPESDWQFLIAVENFGTRLRLNWPEGPSSLNSIMRANTHCSLQESLSRHVQSSELINLLCGLLKYEPSECLTALQAMDHPFFTKNKRWDIDQEGNTIAYPKGK